MAKLDHLFWNISYSKKRKLICLKVKVPIYLENSSQILAAEIKGLQEDLPKNRDTIDGQWSDLEQKTREFEEQERQWRDTNLALLRLKTQVQQYETFLQPVQDQLDQIRQKLETISQWLMPMESNGSAYHYAINS